jgi:hypothetical protein
MKVFCGWKLEGNSEAGLVDVNGHFLVSTTPEDDITQTNT